MDITSLLVNTAIAMLLGTAIGLKNEQELISKEILESEANGGKQVVADGKLHASGVIGGFRTHAMLSLIGVISGVFYVTGNPLFTGLITGIVMLLILIYYASGAFMVKAYGITDEMSAIFAHLIGLMMIIQPVPIKMVIALSVIVVFIVTRKDMIRGMRHHINQKEVYEYSLFAIIALVILPFLPNESYRLTDISFLAPALEGVNFAKLDALKAIELINPFKTWFIVVFVSGIDLAGHLMSKFISKGNSQFMSASIGGFVSSTSTTIALAIQSKGKKSKKALDNLVASALAANASSFIQILILVSPISFVFFKRIFVSTIILAVGGYLAALYINSKANQNTKKDSSTEKKASKSSKVDDYTEQESDEAIFRLEPALKFALLLTSVKIVTKVALVYLGNSGFVLTSMMAAVTGIDAIMINVGELANIGKITLQLAFYTYMGANFVNLVSKVIYAYVSGEKAFAKKFAMYIMGLFLISFFVGLYI